MINLTPEATARVNTLYQQDELITARKIVQDARSPKSPLHHYFEWDTQKAAYRHWINTARSIIRSVRIDLVVENKKVESVAYVRDPGQKAGYASIGRIRTSREASLEALKAEFQRVADVLRRAKEVAVGLGLESEIEKLLSQVGARQIVILRRARLATPRLAAPPRQTARRRAR